MSASGARVPGGAARASLAEMARRLRSRPPLPRLALAGLIGFVLVSPFSISAAQFFVFVATCAWLVSLGRVERAKQRASGGSFDVRFPLWRPFALFAALTVASALFSEDPLRSLLDARELFQILIFYCALNAVRDEWEALWLVKALFAATGIASAYTLALALGRPITLANRMSGFFSIYMTLGGFLVIVGGLALAYLLLPGGAGRGRWVYGAAALILGALMTTFSRNAWIGMAVALLVIALAGRSGKAAAFVAAAAALVFLLGPQAVRERFRSMADPQDPTAVERIYMWKSGLRMIRDRPLFGFGPGLIKRDYPRYVDPRARKRRTGHLHNNLLHIAAERGLPALAAWLWVWVAFFAAVLRRLGPSREGAFGVRFLRVGALAAVAGFLAAGLFEYNFGDSEVVMTAYFAMALPFMAGQGRAP